MCMISFDPHTEEKPKAWGEEAQPGFKPRTLILELKFEFQTLLGNVIKQRD